MAERQLTVTLKDLIDTYQIAAYRLGFARSGAVAAQKELDETLKKYTEAGNEVTEFLIAHEVIQRPVPSEEIYQ
nr:MAG TPA: hypothetical protein [Caudoviricetes sp.]